MRIVIDRLSVVFHGVPVLHEVSAAFPEGRLSVVAGPSGSGKSTLLSVLGGLRRPTLGQVWWIEGDSAVAPRRRDTAWVVQGNHVIGARSALDNAMLSALADGAAAQTAAVLASEALARVGLSHRASAAGRTLSGGEAQRVALARVLAGSRSLILADEPTANLDRDSAMTVARTLWNLRGTRTIVVATHDQALIDAAEHVVRLAR